MKHLRILILLTVVAISASCSMKNYNERQLVGRWFSVGWLRDDIETDMTAWFEFNEDKTYRAVIARNKEQGKWWVDGYKLYTQADGGEPIVVKIEKIDDGNLELGMNRAGQRELLIFTKSE